MTHLSRMRYLVPPLPARRSAASEMTVPKGMFPSKHRHSDAKRAKRKKNGSQNAGAAGCLTGVTTAGGAESYLYMAQQGIKGKLAVFAVLHCIGRRGTVQYCGSLQRVTQHGVGCVV